MSDLVARTAAYVSIPSVSGDEAAIAGEIESTLRGAPHLEVRRIGDNVVARTTGPRPRRVVLAGHIDTVPGDAGAAVVDDGMIRGLGACDMKGSVAVMVELAVAPDAFGSELTWVFYAREEVALERSGLLEITREAPGLLDADVALVCEPTSCAVEAGCQGTLHLRVTLRGARAHTARPWRGRNAIHRLEGLLGAVAAYEPRSVELDGVVFTEQLQAVAVTGGVAGNVVPDLATLSLNHRIAPDRSVADAIAAMHSLIDPLLEDGDGFEVLDSAEPALPNLSNPMLARLVELSGVAPRAKLGYTDVSHFASLGVAAANFGAGDPELAHHPGEQVAAAQLERCHDVLSALLAEGPSA